MKKIVKDALILFAITLVAGILLGIVYQITLDPIAKANENAKQKAYKEVLTEADSFEVLENMPEDDKINASSDIDNFLSNLYIRLRNCSKKLLSK